MQYNNHGLSMTIPDRWGIEEKDMENAHGIFLKGPAHELAIIRIFNGTMPLPMAMEVGKRMLSANVPGVTPVPIQEPFMGGTGYGFKIELKGEKTTLYGKLLILLTTQRVVMAYVQFLKPSIAVSLPALTGVLNSLRLTA